MAESLTLDQLLAIEDEIAHLTSPLEGEWATLNPTQAVIKAIRHEKELRDYLRQHRLLITTSGNIGLGKTTFTRIFSHSLEIEGSYELDAEKDHISDELLSKFLLNKQRYCFELQQHLLTKRLSHRERSNALGKSCAEDRTPDEDPGVFHLFFKDKGYLTEAQVAQLQEEAINAYKNAPKSDLMITLLGSPELSRLRILQRKRPEEIHAWRLKEELTPLAKLYVEFPEKVPTYGLHKGSLLTVDLGKIDITNRVHEGYVYEQILNRLKS